MADETETAVAAAENEAAVSEETKAGDETAQADAATETKDTPGEEREETPEPTRFEKLIAETEDSGQRRDMIQRVIDGLPEEEREKLPALQSQLATAEAGKQQDAMRAREDQRRGQIRGYEEQSTGAQSRIDSHIKETLTKTRAQAKDLDNEDPDISYDNGLISKSISEIVEAEVFLRDQDSRRIFGDAVVSRIHNLGDPIDTGRLQEMARQADSEDGKRKHGMVGAYLDELISRASKAGYAEGLKEGGERLDRFKSSELSAYLSDEMRGMDMEPNTEKGTRKGKGITLEQLKKMTREEVAAVPREERERAMSAS